MNLVSWKALCVLSLESLCTLDFLEFILSLLESSYNHYGPMGLSHSEHLFFGGVGSSSHGFNLLVMSCSSLASFLALRNHEFCGVLMIFLWICGVAFLSSVLRVEFDFGLVPLSMCSLYGLQGITRNLKSSLKPRRIYVV